MKLTRPAGDVPVRLQTCHLRNLEVIPQPQVTSPSVQVGFSTSRRAQTRQVANDAARWLGGGSHFAI